RELAKARKAAFAEPPVRCNQVWQLGDRLLLQVRARLAHLPACAGADAVRRSFRWACWRH
ncbi:MAG TPA: hypothetical protein DHU96_04215, partial [Actinobacteria bacterium]|nr:hypothetical protein [Actinomycetota bacterium]